MTINKSQLGNKRVALNTLADAIDTNIEAAATVTVADTAERYTGENVEACLAEIAGEGRTSETVKDNYDGIVLLNARDEHLPVHATQIIKHPLMAVATYDFAVHGGEISEIDLTTNDVIPDNAIITDVVVDVVTAIVTTDTSGTITFQLPTDGALSTAIPDTAAGIFSGLPGNISLAGNSLTAANMGVAKAAT